MVALIIELRTTLLYLQSAGYFAVNFEKFWYEVVKIFGPAVEDHRGDALAIFSTNGADRVDEFLEWYGMARDDVGAGPGNSAYRWRPLQWSSGGKDYVNERTVGVQQTAWAFVATSRGWLPPPISRANSGLPSRF